MNGQFFDLYLQQIASDLQSLSGKNSHSSVPWVSLGQGGSHGVKGLCKCVALIPKADLKVFLNYFILFNFFLKKRHLQIEEERESESERICFVWRYP